jgi:hypothetical protein
MTLAVVAPAALLHAITLGAFVGSVGFLLRVALRLGGARE